MRTAEQIKNHLKTWQKKWQKINKLRKLSAAGWDENNFIITLDAEHYNSYVQDHKADAEFLNKPLPHFGYIQTIFGNSMATGNFAKDSSTALGTEDGDHDADTETEEVTGYGLSDGPTTADNNGATSSASKPNKKAKIFGNDDDGLIAAFKSVGESLSNAIKLVANPDEVSGLFDTLVGLPGFESTHISLYYAYLVANPNMARAFMGLPFEYKINWLALFVSEKFPGQQG